MSTIRDLTKEEVKKLLNEHWVDYGELDDTAFVDQLFERYHVLPKETNS